MMDKVLHCWADEAGQYEVGSNEWAEAYAHGGGTCMLPAGHDGPHVFTPDDEIVIVFADEDDLVQ
jgi:hypothetical protein